MKLAYKNWNRDHYVSDDNIHTDIKMISGGKLNLEKGADLDVLGGPDNDQNTSRSTGKKRGRPKSRRNYKKRRSNKH
jgi:hypothetical protein